jgi:hypothetical protein
MVAARTQVGRLLIYGNLQAYLRVVCIGRLNLAIYRDGFA